MHHASNLIPRLALTHVLGLLGALAAGCHAEPTGDARPAASGSARAPATLSSAAVQAREAAWAAPSDAPPPFAGALTPERVIDARRLLAAPKMEPKVMPLLVGTLGPPARTTTGTHALVGKEQKRFAWAAKSPTTCAVLFAVEQPNALPEWPPGLAEDLGSGEFPMPKALPTTQAKDNVELQRAWQGYAACLDVLGEKPRLPPDAPGARGPASVVTAADLAFGLTRAPNKWLGARVVVEGRVSFGGARTVIETAKGGVTCRPAAAATGLDPDKKVRVRGTVADLRVSDLWGYDLVDCELAR